MSSIKVTVSVVDSSGILAEVSVASGNNFIVAATYEPTIASLLYALIKADVFNPFALSDIASTSEIVLRHPKPVYSDLVIISDPDVKIINSVLFDSAVAADLFASTLVKNVDFDTATAQVDSEPVTTSEVFVPILNALDSYAFNGYSFNSASLN